VDDAEIRFASIWFTAHEKCDDDRKGFEILTYSARMSLYPVRVPAVGLPIWNNIKDPPIVWNAIRHCSALHDSGGIQTVSSMSNSSSVKVFAWASAAK
jgi:hypothetical protein